MKRYYGKGAITVFLSLIGVLFLSLLCTAAESARIQGCRAKAAAALDMGMFSVMGEFERELLDHYDVFLLDGAAGTESYSLDKVSEVLREYMEYNVDPNKGMWLKGFDPFTLKMDTANITGVSLATDGKGAAFYQQAVGFMRENLGTELASALIERMQEGKQLEEAGELYEKRNNSITKELAQLEEQQKKQEQEEREKAEQNGQTENQAAEEAPKVPESKNPLSVIKKLKKKGILALVLDDGVEISEKELPSGSPSGRNCQKGNLPVEKTYGGLIDDLIFQQYLFEHFSLFTDKEKEGVLDYGLEYVLCGKKSDLKNLKGVVNRLLLMREGANFLYLAADSTKMQAANALAALLVGAIPLPGLVTVTAYALLLAWAYGESLLDVRELLAGGRIPVKKTESTWRLQLSSLADLPALLKSADGSSKQGLSYAQYLQMLFAVSGKGNYAMRALDLIEGYMRARPATAAFRADHAISKIKAEAGYTIPPLFLRVSAAFLKTGKITQNYQAQGVFGY
ncbi:MAG: DUF5702 domain-containing protein [Eubacteriales bacterium]|nr:DUF5702 domain-containing protein [Eubacteriales bacterium]